MAGRRGRGRGGSRLLTEQGACRRAGVPRPWDQDLGWRQVLNGLSPPGAAVHSCLDEALSCADVCPHCSAPAPADCAQLVPLEGNQVRWLICWCSKQRELGDPQPLLNSFRIIMFLKLQFRMTLDHYSWIYSSRKDNYFIEICVGVYTHICIHVSVSMYVVHVYVCVYMYIIICIHVRMYLWCWSEIGWTWSNREQATLF